MSNDRRWYPFNSYFGPIEVEAHSEGEAYEKYSQLLRRLFVLTDLIRQAFEKYHARSRDPDPSPLLRKDVH
jgi:hypothetical protein